MAEDVRVIGLREFKAALKTGDKELKKQVRDRIRKVGEVVRADAAERFDRYYVPTADGFRVRVRQRGVAVEQSRRRTTGLRPDYGALQMRKALLPALADKEDTVTHELELALEDVKAIVEHG